MFMFECIYFFKMVSKLISEAQTLANFLFECIYFFKMFSKF